MSAQDFPGFPQSSRQMADNVRTRSQARRAAHVGDAGCGPPDDDVLDAFAALDERCTPDELFALLQQHFQFGGAALEFISSDRPETPIDVLYKIPPAFMLRVASMMDSDPAVHILLNLDPGFAGRDIDMAIDAQVLRDAEVTKTLYPEYGFHWIAALSVSEFEDNNGRVALYLFGRPEEAGRAADPPLTDRDLIRLENLCKPIAGAVGHMGLPRGLRHATLRADITERAGHPTRAAYVLQADDGTIIEVTYHALQVANGYLPSFTWSRDTNPFAGLLGSSPPSSRGARIWNHQRHSLPAGDLITTWRRIDHSTCALSRPPAGAQLLVLTYRIDPVLRYLVGSEPTLDSTAPIDLFIMSSEQDGAYREELARHLRVPQRRRLITYWHRGLLQAGDNEEDESRHFLEGARIVLVLASADLFASETSAQELESALRAQRNNRLRVVPILLRPCRLQDTPLAAFAPLPRSRQPVTVLSDRDDAWEKIVGELIDLLDRK